MVPDADLDEQTTPVAARPLVIVGLTLLATYFVLCFHLALAGFGLVGEPAWLRALEPALWAGRWRMFTDLRTTHTDLDVERLDADWQPMDLAAFYPMHWDEGPGYTRDAFLDDPRRIAALADDLCARTDARALRLTRVVFDKTPGSREQPRVNPRSTLLLERRCAR